MPTCLKSVPGVKTISAKEILLLLAALSCSLLHIWLHLKLYNI